MKSANLKVRTIHALDELAEIEAAIQLAAANTIAALRGRLETSTPVEAMAAMKFETIGFDPLGGHPLHLIEQINQMFTYLTSCEAARYLLEHHPTSAPFTLNLGTSSGTDIVSADGRVAAEVFAATHPNSNDKLRRDAAKVRDTGAEHRYVFYSCPTHEPGERPRLAKAEGVGIVSLGVWSDEPLDLGLTS